MKKDAFWQTKINDYIDLYAFFVNLMQSKIPNIDLHIVNEHWQQLLETVCDCEGCREDTDCTVHITMDEDESGV
jgi:hypothetical protein